MSSSTADNTDMRFERCPYCQEPVELTLFAGGWIRIECDSCGAQWEAHGGMVRRIADGELLGVSGESKPDESREPARFAKA